MATTKRKPRSLSDVTSIVLGKKSQVVTAAENVSKDFSVSRKKISNSEAINKKLDLPKIKMVDIQEDETSEKNKTLVNAESTSKPLQKIKKQHLPKLKKGLNDSKITAVVSPFKKKQETSVETNNVNLKKIKTFKSNSGVSLNSSKKVARPLPDIGAKKITIIVDETAINEKIAKLEQEVNATHFLKIKKPKKSNFLKSPNLVFANKEITADSNLITNKIAYPTKRLNQLVTTVELDSFYTSVNQTTTHTQLDVTLEKPHGQTPYPEFSNYLDSISSNLPVANSIKYDLDNPNRIAKEKLETIRLKYNSTMQIKNLVNDAQTLSSKNKMLTQFLLTNPNKKKEIITIVLAESKVNPREDALRNQLGKLSTYLGRLKTLIADLEFDINAANINFEEGCDAIQEVELKIYVTEHILTKLYDKLALLRKANNI